MKKLKMILTGTRFALHFKMSKKKNCCLFFVFEILSERTNETKGNKCEVWMWNIKYVKTGEKTTGYWIS